MSKSARKVMALVTAGFATFYPVLADTAGSSTAAYNAGVKLYTQKDYRSAAQQFEAAMKAAPNNPDAIYYCALCAQLSNNRARAKQLFQYLSQRFPQSRVGPLAQTALNQLNSTSGSTGGGSDASAGAESSTLSSLGVASHGGYRGGGPDLADVPDLVRIPFEKRGNDVTVMMQVNGRPVQFILDTGASTVCVGMNHLKEWGIWSSQAQKTFEMGGVGEGKAKGWNQKLDLKLGQIYRKDFPVSVMDNMPTEPLLGQTFLRSFNVSIDDNTRTVLLAKKGGTAAKDIVHRSYNSVEVPFTRGPGGHMMVNVDVNGKPFVMMFDTGCERTCFAMSDWKKLGFEMPGDAKQGMSRGVLGDTVTYYFTCDSIKLKGKPRPIEQVGTPASIAEGSPASLLGMSFYGSMKYVIDSQRNVIIFEGER